MKIDVIICAYNAHKHIKRAIDSIIKQTIIDKINITIVDDGSTYGYEDTISCYDKKINLITLKKNKGIGHARQVALKNTFNEFLIFLDSDDEFYDNKSLEKLYNIISKNNDIDVVVGKIISNNEIMTNPFTYLHGKMYRRQFIKKNNIKFLSIRISEDTAFNLAISTSGANTKLIDDVISIYYRDIDDSITKTIRNRIELLKVMVIVCDYAYKKTKDYSIFKERITNVYEHLIYSFIERKGLENADDLTNYARICKKFYKKYKNYILDSDYINMYKNIFEVF